jgi:hypothetical protein
MTSDGGAVPEQDGAADAGLTQVVREPLDAGSQPIGIGDDAGESAIDRDKGALRRRHRGTRAPARRSRQ